MPRGVRKTPVTYTCVETFFSDVGDGQMGVQYPEDDIRVKRHPRMFSRDQPYPAPAVEAATAAPGEQRTVIHAEAGGSSTSGSKA